MSQNDESKKKPKDLINRYFDGVLPIKDSKFTANLLRSGIDNIFPLPNGELSKFRRTEDRSQHNTYGMTQQERDDAVINYSTQKACLVDKSGTPVNVDYVIYNVTADKKLICRTPELMNYGFNHSSITRDGAIECAGHITIKDGIITAINNYSGHYCPTPLDLYNAINTIKKYGDNVFSVGCEVSCYKPESEVKSTIPEFMKYMHEFITNAQGQLVPRVAQMRIDRYDAHHAVGSGTRKLDQGDNIIAGQDAQMLLDSTVPTIINQHQSTAQVSEQTQPLQFDAMEVYQIRDLYNITTPQIQSEILAYTNRYSERSAALCGWIVQTYSKYEVDNVKIANEVLTNMLAWDKKDIQASEEIKNTLKNNSYFVGFGEHCNNPQVKKEFFNKMGKLAVISGVPFEDLATYNQSEDTVHQLKTSYNLHKELEKASHAMKGFAPTENLSSSTARPTRTSRPRSNSL